MLSDEGLGFSGCLRSVSPGKLLLVLAFVRFLLLLAMLLLPLLLLVELLLLPLGLL